jgi:hypothetical protein
VTDVSHSVAASDRVLMDLASEYLSHVRSLPLVQAALKGPDDAKAAVNALEPHA